MMVKSPFTSQQAIVSNVLTTQKTIKSKSSHALALTQQERHASLEILTASMFIILTLNDPNGTKSHARKSRTITQLPHVLGVKMVQKFVLGLFAAQSTFLKFV